MDEPVDIHAPEFARHPFEQYDRLRQGSSGQLESGERLGQPRLARLLPLEHPQHEGEHVLPGARSRGHVLDSRITQPEIQRGQIGQVVEQYAE